MNPLLLPFVLALLLTTALVAFFLGVLQLVVNLL